MGDFDKYRLQFSSLSALNLIEVESIEERGNQSGLIIDELLLYNILIRDLVDECPNDDIRNQILNIAYYIIDDLECYEETVKERQLPIIKIKKRIPISKSFLQLWKDYIIAYVVILGNPSYKYIQEYLGIEEKIKIIGAKDLVVCDTKILHKGVLISKSGKKGIILTAKGEFKKIDVIQDNYIGEEVSGEEYKGLKKYKLHMSIMALLIIAMVSVATIKYMSVKNTIIINTTSSIKVEVNSFNKIVNAQSPTDKGARLLSEIKIQDKDVDESIYKILKYALENEMIPNDDMLITVSGKSLDLEILKETNKFLKDNNIPVKFNNSGNEYYINH